MKKIITIMIMAIISISGTYGYTICAKDNTFVGVLRKNVNGTVIDVTDTGGKKQWVVEYNYKTITGCAACNEISGSVGVPQTNLYTNAGDAGRYFWCQMWPVYDDDDTTNYHYETGITSYWVYLDDYGTAADCASDCTSDCASAMATNRAFRSAVFESVW